MFIKKGIKALKIDETVNGDLNLLFSIVNQDRSLRFEGGHRFYLLPCSLCQSLLAETVYSFAFIGSFDRS